EAAHGPQRHVDRLAAVVDGPSPMGHTGRRSSRLAPRAGAATTPVPERERALTGMRHLDWADIIESKQLCQAHPSWCWSQLPVAISKPTTPGYVGAAPIEVPPAGVHYRASRGFARAVLVPWAAAWWGPGGGCVG